MVMGEDRATTVLEVLRGLAEAETVRSVRPTSLWALQLALRAARTAGLSGELRLTFPPNPNHPMEADFSTLSRQPKCG